MKREEIDFVAGSPPCQAFRSFRLMSRLRVPRLESWSIVQADVAEVTGQARSDYERELRISALGMLVCSPAATPLWRRVCNYAMRGEIRTRSNDQRLAVELAIAESMRTQR